MMWKAADRTMISPYLSKVPLRMELRDVPTKGLADIGRRCDTSRADETSTVVLRQRIDKTWITGEKKVTKLRTMWK